MRDLHTKALAELLYAFQCGHLDLLFRKTEHLNRVGWWVECFNRNHFLEEVFVLEKDLLLVIKDTQKPKPMSQKPTTF